MQTNRHSPASTDRGKCLFGDIPWGIDSGRGAAATSDGRRDYVAFWQYVLAICREVRASRLTPVVPCICLPEQVLAAANDEAVHFLALLSDPGTVRRRIAGRSGVSEVPSPESHVDLDRRLREVADVPRPHTWSTYDVSAGGVRQTLEAGSAWAEVHARGLSGPS